MGLVAVRLAQREKPLEGLLTAEDPLAVIAALVTHLRVDWPSGAEAEVGDLTAAAAKGSEEAGLESLFLGAGGGRPLAFMRRPLCCQVLQPFAKVIGKLYKNLPIQTWLRILALA